MFATRKISVNTNRLCFGEVDKWISFFQGNGSYDDEMTLKFHQVLRWARQHVNQSMFGPELNDKLTLLIRESEKFFGKDNIPLTPKALKAFLETKKAKGNEASIPIAIPGSTKSLTLRFPGSLASSTRADLQFEAKSAPAEIKRTESDYGKHALRIRYYNSLRPGNKPFAKLDVPADTNSKKMMRSQSC